MKLFVVGSPYWYWSMRPRECAETGHVTNQSDDPLDEHHSYFYHLFLKYGVVDEVVIYSERKTFDGIQHIPDHVACAGGVMRLDYDLDHNELKSSPKSLVYCRHNLPKVRQFGDHFRIIKAIADGFPKSPFWNRLPTYVPGLCRNRRILPEEHELVLSEGPYNQRFLPRGSSSVVWPTLSAQSQYVSAPEKKYDWAISASFARRKNIYGFCKGLIDNGLGHLKGCIMYLAHENYTAELGRFREQLMPHLDIELHPNANCESKMHRLCESRVLVSAATEDSGPRSVIEAGQAGIPVLALASHGSASYLVRPGVNGELTWQPDQLPRILGDMLDRIDQYDCSINRELLDEQRCFAPVIDAVHQEFT